MPFASMRKTLLDDLPRWVAACSDNSQRRSGMTSSSHTSSHTLSSTLRRTLRRLRFVAHVDLHPTRYVPCPAHTAALRRGIPSPSAGGWRLPVTASFGVGVGIGIGVDFCRSVFARFLAHCIPSLAEFLVAKRHSDLFFRPRYRYRPRPRFYPLPFVFPSIHPLISNRLRSRFDAYEVCYASALCVKTGFAPCC